MGQPRMLELAILNEGFLVSIRLVCITTTLQPSLQRLALWYPCSSGLMTSKLPLSSLWLVLSQRGAVAATVSIWVGRSYEGYQREHDLGA